MVSSENSRSEAASVASASDNALVDAGALLDARLDLFLQFGVFGVEPLQRHVGIGRLLLLAGDVGGKLRQAAVEFGDALLGALFLAVEQFAGVGEPLQPGGGAGFGLAQRRQFGGADRLDAGGFGLLAGALGHLADVEVVGARGLADVGIGFHPAQMEQHRLGLAHLGGDLAVADRLPRLLLQAVHLAGELADHVLDAGEVGLGGAQPQFGLVAAGVQAGDAGGIFQHAAALLGLGLDDLADLALVDQCRRTRAGRGIGKQDLHVARAHVAAVDAIDRARLALDAAGDFQNLRSFIAAGAERSELSIVITTSAWLRAGRLPEPAKITASMSAARSDLCEVSPIAQRSASTRFDLPQPFGPTTPVRPGSIMKSVGSTNDLKP